MEKAICLLFLSHWRNEVKYVPVWVQTNPSSNQIYIYNPIYIVYQNWFTPQVSAAGHDQEYIYMYQILPLDHVLVLDRFPVNPYQPSSYYFSNNNGDT